MPYILYIYITHLPSSVVPYIFYIYTASLSSQAVPYILYIYTAPPLSPPLPSQVIPYILYIYLASPSQANLCPTYSTFTLLPPQANLCPTYSTFTLLPPSSQAVPYILYIYTASPPSHTVPYILYIYTVPLRLSINFDRYIGCFKCGLPEFICSKRGKAGCRQPPLLYHACWTALCLDKRYGPRLLELLGGPSGEGLSPTSPMPASVIRWLGIKRRLGGEEICNAAYFLYHWFDRLESWCKKGAN